MRNCLVVLVAALLSISVAQETLVDDDVVVVEAIPFREGRDFDGGIPTDNSAAGQAGFKLPVNDDVVIIEAAPFEGREISSDIPRDESGTGKAGFRLPLVDDDAVVLEAAEDGRELGSEDIPRDESGRDLAGFRLPLPDVDEAVVIEAAEDGRELGSEDIPRDESGRDLAGFRLPLPDDEVVVVGEVDAIEITPASPGQAGFRIPRLNDDDDVIVVDSVDCFAERDPGQCDGQEEAYFYDRDHNKCHFFIYSGCGGNTNRFSTEADCHARCKDAKRGPKCDRIDPADCPCDLSLGTDGCLECQCSQDVDRSVCSEAGGVQGRCRGAFPHWFFDAQLGECKEFIFGGCEAGATRNRFRTKELCQKTCLE